MYGKLINSHDMKIKRKDLTRYIIIAFMILVNGIYVFGQPGGPPGGNGGGDPVGGGAGVPLDGGVIAMLVAGAGMLYLRFRKKGRTE